jgi:rRNA processing protein Krr1/Pno1
MDTLHQREKMQSILLRVINMKSNLNEVKENVITLDKLKSEPLEILPVIASNSNLLLKLQRQFGVVLEPKFPGSRVKSFIVYGLLEDVNAFLAFFRSVPWSSPTQITMPQEVIPSIIGKGGHALRQLEEKYKCVIHIKVDGVIALYGSKEDTKKLQEYFETIKTTKRQDSFIKEEFPLENHYIGRALQTTFSDTLRNIESTLNVFIRVMLPQKVKKITSTGEANVTNLPFGGDCSNLNANQDIKVSDAVQGFLVIRGRTVQDVKKAKLEINTIIKEWIIATVSVPSQHLNNLFAFIGGNSRSIDRTESSELWDAAEKLKILVNVTENVAFIKDPIDGIVLVGLKDKVNVLKPQIEELIQKASYVPLKLTLSPAVAAVCCSTDHLQELQEKYGVVIRKLRPSQTIPTSRITIVGPPEASQKAMEEIEEWIQKRGCSVTIKTDNKKILSALQQIDTLRLLEKKKKCRIFFNNAESTITFVGAPEAIVYEEVQFENICKSLTQSKQSKMNSFTDKSQVDMTQKYLCMWVPLFFFL